ncbi:nuclear transport factor 2 family protein [Pedobacter antarcticus]|uniref:nuclear transport factor 2 family protein n=1 Tax=Pedobacter antarcticus TaxID=34086 RepID=UPI00292CD414|nr:nuclear transport factor 2 family protein [Pedobacter antarcticus]
MKTETTRNAIIQLVNNWLTAWSSGNEIALHRIFGPDSTFSSTAHGVIKGNLKIASCLIDDCNSCPFLRLNASNYYISCADQFTSIATISMYIYGGFQSHLNFGGTVIASVHIDQSGSWKFAQLTLTVNWMQGDKSLLPYWKYPTENRLWIQGDPTPLIVSELDSPWVNSSSIEHSKSKIDQITETFSRYSWAIDQADFTLLQTCFTDDSKGNFPPMGYLNGKHEIIGQLKAFRQIWPWMQHFGEILNINLNELENTAQMLVGRINTHDMLPSINETSYGAHYQLSLRLEANVWKITNFDYVPGHFSKTALLKKS